MKGISSFSQSPVPGAASPYVRPSSSPVPVIVPGGSQNASKIAGIPRPEPFQSVEPAVPIKKQEAPDNASGIRGGIATLIGIYENPMSSNQDIQPQRFSPPVQNGMVAMTPIKQSETTTPESISKTARKALNLPEGAWSLSQNEDVTVRNTVSVRVRPFIGEEMSMMSKKVLSVKESQLVITNPNTFDADPELIAEAAEAIHMSGWASTFKFDNLLWSCTRGDPSCEYTDQAGVHRKVGAEIVDYVLNGVSSTCIAYGHTNTGKTHSMFGEDFNMMAKQQAGATVPRISDYSGLIPRVMTDVINSISRRDGSCDDTRFTLSFFEVHNDKIRDLLNATPTGEAADCLKVREHPTLGPYVEGLTKVDILTAAAALEWLVKGMRNRTEAQTVWNINSSRSHVMVLLELSPINAQHQEAKETREVKETKTPTSSSAAKKKVFKKDTAKLEEKETSKVRLCFVDLAGSERDSAPEPVVDPRSSSARKKSSSGKSSSDQTAEKTEHKMIRSSLASLGFVIKAISKAGSTANNKSLPFRDCTLTYLLKESFCGKNFVSLVATLSPCHNHYDESISTLKFAEDIYTIAHKPPQKLAPETPNDMSDFERIKTSLGADQPGSEASRILFRATISDPQQRINKIKSRGDDGHTHKQDHHKFPAIAESSRPVEDMKAFNELRNAYRILQGQVVELQIELDTARTDRDSFLTELKGTKDSLSYYTNYSSGAATSSPGGAQLTSGDQSREIHDLKAIIARKEEMIEKLLADFTESRQKTDRLSAIIDSQKAEYTARIDKLQGYVSWMFYLAE
jgi:hypothetical protein